VDTARRLEQPDGLTEEEQLVRNERIYKVFNTTTPTSDELLSDDRRRKAGKKTTLAPYHGPFKKRSSGFFDF
jgi:hypothetical protein